MQKAAVIGIGSNSVRMLVAQIEEDGFTRLTRDREGTRLFAGLDQAGNLSRTSMEKTAAAVDRMAVSAGKIGCDSLHIFATSASRDARNGADFLALLKEKTGVEPEIISVYYGADVTEADGQKVGKSLAAAFKDADVNVINGGQPVYYYMISLE